MLDVQESETAVGGWREADQQLRRLAARRAALDLEEARWLVIARRERVHAHLGLGSFLQYVERVLGYRPQTARERLRTAEALETLPATRAALDDGRLSFSAARELTRIVTPETERVWLAETANKTIREVEAAIAGRARGDLPWDRRDPQLAPKVVRLELAPSTYALFLETRRQLERQAGQALSDDELMAALCRRELGGAGDANGRSPHQIAVTVCADCQRAWQDGGNQSIEISPTEVERMRCDAVEIGRIDGDKPAKAAQSVPPAIRRMVLARDHHRCTVPGCRAAHDVDVHHVVLRSRGGSHDPTNLTAMCSTHHTAVHDGILRVEGTAPDQLVFRHADGRLYGAPPTGEVAVADGAAVDDRRSHVGDGALRPAAPARSSRARRAKEACGFGYRGGFARSGARGGGADYQERNHSEAPAGRGSPSTWSGSVAWTARAAPAGEPASAVTAAGPAEASCITWEMPAAVPSATNASSTPAARRVPAEEGRAPVNQPAMAI